jgi:aspartate/methionine/tyrosine aminotransferase
MMSKYENIVKYNLSESGVHPLTLGELLEMGGRSVDALLATEIDYPQANGAIPLRENIARLYDGATAENVLVTVGAAEANYLTIHTLIEAGDEVVIMRPNYMQVWGNAHNRGARIKDFNLREENDWAPDLAELEAVVCDDTKLIAICNPNNPTGRIMTTAEMDAIVAAAARVGRSPPRLRRSLGPG